MNKILIIKQGALGDIIMLTPLIKLIQAHHAQDKVYLLTSPPFSPLFVNWKNLTVTAFPRKGFLATINTISWIRKNKFSRIYDFQSNDRSGLLCALSDVKERVGNHPRYPYNIHPHEKYTGQKHIYERMLDIVTSAGIKPTHTIPDLPASRDEVSKVADWLRENNLENKDFVIMHGGSSPEHLEKRWPHYHELALKLESSGYIVVFIGADADLENNKKLSKDVGIDATNLFSINELAELGKRACFAFTNDSGPMHILSCASIPVYAFFGPTNWKRNHAINQEKNVFATNNNENITAISLERVITRLKEDGYIKN